VKIKDIVEMSASFLELDDVLNALNSETEITDKTILKNIDLLVRCSNLALSVLASEKFKLKKVENLYTENGEIKIDNFSKNVFEILEVKKNNINIDFRVYPNLVDCFKKGTYQITYAYLPDFKTLDEVVDDFDQKVPLRIISEFVASEFSFISGDFEDASVWEQKYKESLDNLNFTKSRKLPERRWF